MLNRIFEFALNNRFLILVFAGLIIASGVYSMSILPIDAVPDVTPNQVQILTNAPGLGPVEVEKFITFPVETAMSGLPGIELIRSSPALAYQPSRSISMKEWISIFAVVW